MNKCPLCGANGTNNIVVDVASFDCGTDIIRGVYERGHTCYENELATLREELTSETLSYKSLADHAEVHERELRAEIAALNGLLRQALTALLEADSLFVRCFEWSKGEASISVPVQKLGLDIADWGRRWALIDDELEEALKEKP